MRVWCFVVLMVLALLPVQAKAETSHAATRSRGFAAHYRPGLFAKVVKNRRMKVTTKCLVASPFYPIGTILKVQSQVTTKRKVIRTVLTCTVADVPQPHHRQRIINRGIGIELDFTSATILCGIRRVAEEPPRACPVIYWRA